MNKLSIWSLIPAFVCAALLAQPAAAQQDLKIGVVNVARLLDQAPQAKAAMEALQDEFAPRQREIVAAQQSLQEKQERVTRDGQVMGEDERNNIQREIREDQRDLQRRQNEYVEDLNLRRNEELGKLQRSLLQEVQAFAQTAGYDLVVADVLFASSAVDITGEVLKGLEQRFSKN